MGMGMGDFWTWTGVVLLYWNPPARACVHQPLNRYSYLYATEPRRPKGEDPKVRRPKGKYLHISRQPPPPEPPPEPPPLPLPPIALRASGEALVCTRGIQSVSHLYACMCMYMCACTCVCVHVHVCARLHERHPVRRPPAIAFLARPRLTD